MRSPIGEKGVGTGSRWASAASAWLAIGLQRVDAQVDRRAIGERPALVDRRLAETLGEGRRQPFGIVALHMRGRAGEIARPQPLALGFAQRRRRVALAGEQRRDLLFA